jgi:hypothetical protein
MTDVTCPWCAAPARPEDTVCSACGAALAQRESIGDVRIPGLTAVDPALEDYDKRPMHLRGPSPSQGVAPALIIGAVAGGPIGLVAIGGVAAVAGAEFLAARGGSGSMPNLEDVGKPSEVLLQALEQERNAGGAGPAGPATALGSTIGADAAAESDPMPTGEAAPEADAAAADGGMSIWRDLPPPTDGGTDGDPAGGAA